MRDEQHWRLGVVVWWSWFWRFSVSFMLVCLVAGMLIVAVNSSPTNEITSDLSRPFNVTGVLVTVVWVVLQIWAMKQSLKRHGLSKRSSATE